VAFFKQKHFDGINLETGIIPRFLFFQGWLQKVDPAQRPSCLHLSTFYIPPRWMQVSGKMIRNVVPVPRLDSISMNAPCFSMI